MRFFNNTDFGYFGAALNFNPNVNNASFNTGHNFTHRTVTATQTVTVPVGAPDLIVAKTHSGNFTVGSTGAYTITVTNNSSTAMSALFNRITVSDSLPGNLTLASFSGAGWSCTGVNSNSVTCQITTALGANASAAPLTLTVNVGAGTPTGTNSITNTVQVQTLQEFNFDNNSASDPTTVTAPSTCPTINNINPTSGPVGSQVVITGTNFTGDTEVRFTNNVVATFVTNNSTQITATVPAGAATGPITIRRLGDPCAPSSSGTFTVTNDSCTTFLPIAYGQTLNGVLQTGDCTTVFGDGSFSDLYTFNGTAGDQIAIALNSSAFDTYLALFNSGGMSIAQNNNGGGGTNARIPANGGFFTLPVTGAYFIAANTFEPAGSGAYSISLGVYTSGLQFYPLPAPVRLLETRAGFSGCTTPGVPINANGTLTLPARTACAGIPANAAAITGNITVVPSAGGFLTLFPSSAAQPQVANSNFAAGEITNNVFTVALGASDGAFKIFSQRDDRIAIVDLSRGITRLLAANGLFFHPLPDVLIRLAGNARRASRAALRRVTPLNGTGDLNADPNLDLSFARSLADCPAACNSIPASARRCWSATQLRCFPASGGHLTIYPSGGASARLIASSNYAGGDVINGPFAVKLGADGKFKVYTFATTRFSDRHPRLLQRGGGLMPTGQGCYSIRCQAPVRLLETRPDFPGFPLTGCTRTNAKIPGNLASATHTQSAGGFCGLPAVAQAVVGNVSVVNSEGTGFLTLFPGNLATAPLVATSNYPAPATFGYNRHYFVGLSSVDGKFKVLTQFTTDLILDASGYFAP